jgi:hypothetical protein
MTATIGAATYGSRPEPINDTCRRLRRMGFDDAEATNLTALRNGFGICAQPWTVREVTHLLFLRESHRVGRRWSDADDRADGTDRAPVPATVDQPPVRVVGDETSVPVVESRHRDDAVSSDSRVTLLTLFRLSAGPDATLDLLRPSAPLPLDGAGDSDRRGG